jgi:hypothetical protein
MIAWNGKFSEIATYGKYELYFNMEVRTPLSWRDCMPRAMGK